MTNTIAHSRSASRSFSKIADYVQLVKLRLTLMVVFSAGVGFVIASGASINWFQLVIVLISGFLITGSANGINQIIEKNLDVLMSRTNNRPVAQRRISSLEAGVVVILMGIVGSVLLGYYVNGISAWIGAVSLIVYAFVYTPLKRVSNLSVIAGSFAGAAPPVIGYAAVTGAIDELCILVFLIQFIWQFPHFWAVAWILDDDYKKAGFFLLPSKMGRDKRSAKYIIAVTISLILVGIYLILMNYVGWISGVLILILTLNFLYQSIRLYKTMDLKEARKLMFGSFYYLPLVQILLVTGN